MTEEEVAALTEKLKGAPEAVLREVVREAELFLADQLKSALAADSRAMTLSGILGAIITLLTGSSVSLTAAKFNIWPYESGVGLMIVCLIVALKNSIQAAKPTSFYFCGNSPNNWVEDVESSLSLEESLAGVSALYARGISENSAILESNQQRLARTFVWVAASVAGLLATEVMIFSVKAVKDRLI